MNIRMLWSLSAMVMLGMMSMVAGQAHAIGTGPVVIHHVYGGGGNSGGGGAPYQSDFVVLYNNSLSGVDLTGWILNNGAANQSLPVSGRNATLSGIISAGGYYLIEITTNGTNGIPLSDHVIPNLSTSFGGTYTAGGIGQDNNKVRLIDDLGNVLDFVGFGTANEALVSGVVTSLGSTATNPSNTTSIIRTATSGNNNTDFAIQNIDCGIHSSTVCLLYMSQYTVTFQDRDTTFISSGSVNYGSGATAPANPTRTGYTFSGWSTTFDTIMSDLTVTAEWIDINECMSQALNSCSINASCNNTIGSYTCNCNAGYIGDGITCTICPAGTKQTNNQCVACAENETSDAGSTLCTTVYTYGGPTVLTNGTPGQPLSEPTTIPGEESTLPNNTTDQNDTPSLPSSESISLSTKERIFNPGFTESCFDYIDKSTIDQGVVVSNTFKDAHQLFYSYALTKWQGTSDYRPFSSLTREEAARFFVEFARNVLCRVPNQIYSNQFSDINNADTTLIDFIKASYEYGIFQGDSARDLPVNQTRTFRPKALMTQDEIAAVIVRLVSNQNFDANSDDRASVYRTFLNRYAQSKLLSTKRDNIAEVMYDLYRWNEYNFSNIGYVIIQ